ncbi:hypothetical protein BHK98_03285 [Hornefia porci]|uniref:PIN domain-containing protein n=1 Tax=Hornefia porci TaxID=2652292 RepID=A0A1Q9JGE5_9FIRM|nr:hypothetical protein [Hornefia porci]OLR55171.1 hypothetical protein BHK98_03285 [Hornefia porci]
MEYISSDTNVWIDFLTIDKINLPFLLPYVFLMNSDAIGNELVEPEGLGERLIEHGLVPTEMTTEEFFLAEELNMKYAKPSVFDCVALAIAKNREIVLLSGDGPLRKAAEKEGVEVKGTLGILKELYDNFYIDKEEYLSCLKKLQHYNGGKVRLPSRIIELMIEQLIE